MTSGLLFSPQFILLQSMFGRLSLPLEMIDYATFVLIVQKKMMHTLCWSFPYVIHTIYLLGSQMFGEGSLGR